MNRKEEILAKATNYIFDEHEGAITGIFNAMEEYANQKAEEAFMAARETVSNLAQPPKDPITGRYPAMFNRSNKYETFNDYKNDQTNDTKEV